MSFSHYFLRVIRYSLEKFQVINNKQIIIHISRISAHAQKSALLRISAHPSNIVKHVPLLNKRPLPLLPHFLRQQAYYKHLFLLPLYF